MCRHHYFEAARDDGLNHILERLGRRWVKTGRRLVEKQHGGIASECTRQREMLLLSPRHAPRRAAAESGKSHQVQQFIDTGIEKIAGQTRGFQCIANIARGTAPEHRGTLEHKTPPQGWIEPSSGPGHLSARWREQSHGYLQQSRL